MKTILLSLLGICLFFCACNKSDEASETELKYSIPMIKTMVSYNYDGTPQTFHYQYDALGRIVQYTFSPNGVVSYRYLSDTMIVAEARTNETLVQIDSLRLNDQGMAIIQKTWEKGQSPMGNAYTYTSMNEYDSEGYLIKSNWENIGYEIKDGNAVKQIYYYRSNEPWQDSIDVVTYNIRYQFLPNSRNTIGYENRGMPFLGKQNKNLVSTIESSTSDTPDQYNRLNSFTYELDASQRVIKEFSGNSKLSATYTYYN